MSQGIALEGMRLVVENLPRAYANATDIDARANMMSAASMDAMSHPIGAVHNTHHGTTNAVCMPAVLQFNAPVIRERFDHVANFLGIDGGFDGFCEFVDQFNDSFQIPRTLTALGVEAPNLDRLVDASLRDPSVGGNPVAMTVSNTRALFEAVM